MDIDCSGVAGQVINLFLVILHLIILVLSHLQIVEFGLVSFVTYWAVEGSLPSQPIRIAISCAVGIGLFLLYYFTKIGSIIIGILMSLMTALFVPEIIGIQQKVDPTKYWVVYGVGVAVLLIYHYVNRNRI